MQSEADVVSVPEQFEGLSSNTVPPTPISHLPADAQQCITFLQMVRGSALQDFECTVMRLAQENVALQAAAEAANTQIQELQTKLAAGDSRIKYMEKQIDVQKDDIKKLLFTIDKLHRDSSWVTAVPQYGELAALLSGNSPNITATPNTASTTNTPNIQLDGADSSVKLGPGPQLSPSRRASTPHDEETELKERSGEERRGEERRGEEKAGEGKRGDERGGALSATQTSPQQIPRQGLLAAAATPLLATASGITQALLQRVPSLTPWSTTAPVPPKQPGKEEGSVPSAPEPKSLKIALVATLVRVLQAIQKSAQSPLPEATRADIDWHGLAGIVAELHDLVDELAEQEQVGHTASAVHTSRRLLDALRVQSVEALPVNIPKPTIDLYDDTVSALPLRRAHSPLLDGDSDGSADALPEPREKILDETSADPSALATPGIASEMAMKALEEVQHDAEKVHHATRAMHPASGSVHRRIGRGVRILCLDGGGIRGMLMLECLRKIEADTGRQIHELFDLIGGTSTGGLIAVSLCARKSLTDIAAQYEHIRSAFGGQSAIMSEVKRFTTGTSHSHHTVDAVLKDYLGELHMSSLPVSPKCFVVCAAVDLAPVQPYLFRSYELLHGAFAASEFLGTSHVFAHEAVRATTSAPTYYAPAIIGGQKMVDGAILQNNPSLIAMTEAALLWPGAPIEIMVSLGTGSQTPKPSQPNGVMAWVRTIVDLAMSSHLTHKFASTLLSDRYVRLDPEGCGDYDLGEMRVDVLAKMLEEGRKYIVRQEHKFHTIRTALTRTSARRRSIATEPLPPKADPH